MPIFISYSHSDAEFADRLASQLVLHGANVWIDRWELNVGDSLVDRVQDAISGADALLVLFSKASVQSEWCRRELGAGLLRELEERRVIVLPVIVETCDLPLFVRGKVYADFGADADKALRDVLKAVAPIINASRGRVAADEAGSHTDWAVDSAFSEDPTAPALVVFHGVEHSPSSSYVVLSKVTAVLGPALSSELKRAVKRGDTQHLAWRARFLKSAFEDWLEDSDLDVLIEDNVPVTATHWFGPPFGPSSAAMTLEVRQLGNDTGRDCFYRFGNVVRGVLEHMSATQREA